MDGDRLLLAIGLVRQARPAGFCPACRVLMKALDARQELAKPTVAALVVLAVAGVGWAVLAQPACRRWTGAGSGRRLLCQPDQTGEPGPVPRAMRAAWAASLQPDAERRCRRRALRPQLPWMQRGAHGGHGPSRDVQSVVGG